MARHSPRPPVERAPADDTDITRAREVLDADHHGLEEVKERIVEYLAVRRGAQPAASRSWAAADPVPWCCSQARPARARPRSARGRACAWTEVRPWPSAASATRRRFAGTGVRTSARYLRPDRPSHQGGRFDESGGAPRRGGQGRGGLPRRSSRAAGGAGPGSEPHLPRPLPRSSTSTCRTCCSSPRRTWSSPSPRRCSTGWSSSRSTATPRTTRSRSRATSCCRASWKGRADLRRGHRDRCGTARDGANYTREAGVRADGAADRQAAAKGGHR